MSRSVLAICAADIHLSLKPPVARSCEKDWLAAQQRPLREVRELCRRHKAPFVVAGDLFDRPAAAPELINFALDWLPDNTYAVWGQHDLLHHQAEDIAKTAFWVLVKARKVTPLLPSQPVEIGGLRFWGFPWGTEPVPLKDTHDLMVEVAVVHRYVWCGYAKYQGAEEKDMLRRGDPRWRGYDVVVFGDNHLPWDQRAREGQAVQQFFNCGAFVRRKADEVSIRPSVGLLHSDGTIERHYLDVSKDKWLDLSLNALGLDDAASSADVEKFIADLGELDTDGVDFRMELMRWLDRKHIRPETRKIILEAMV